MPRPAPPRARQLALLTIAAVSLAACSQVVAPPETAEPAPSTTVEVELPDAQAFVPDGVAGTTSWTQMSSLPNEFDDSVAHETPSDLADAFGAAIRASFAGGPQRPDLSLDVAQESDAIAMLIVTETGIGDDSVAGSQYALVIRSANEGWRLDELWTRALCSRGVSGELCV